MSFGFGFLADVAVDLLVDFLVIAYFLLCKWFVEISNESGRMDMVAAISGKILPGTLQCRL